MCQLNFFFAYQNVFVENPWPTFYICFVHFHRAVAQLTVCCIKVASPHSVVKTIAIVLTNTENVALSQTMGGMT